MLSLGGSFLARVLGFFVIFVAGIAGMIIAEIVRFAVRRRRSARLPLWAAIGAALGGLPLILYTLVVALLIGRLTFGLMDLVWSGAYIFIIVSTVYYRLRGIKIS